MSNRLRGLLCALASAALYGLSPIFCKYAYVNGGTPLSVTFLRALIALPIMFAAFSVRRSPRLTRLQVRDGFLAGFFGVTMTAVLLTSSYVYITSGLATTLHFVYPAMTALCGTLLFRERLTRASLAALLAVTAGVVLFSWSTASVQPLGVALALLSGATYTFYIVFLSHSSLREVDTCKLTFCFSAVMAASTGLYGLLTGALSFQMNAAGLAFTAINGVCAALAAALFQVGVRFAGGATASMASALEPATSVLCGVLLFGDPMRAPELLGCAAVCAGVVLLIPRKKHGEPTCEPAPTPVAAPVAGGTQTP